jgi:hypothetical protein
MGLRIFFFVFSPFFFFQLRFPGVLGFRLLSFLVEDKIVKLVLVVIRSPHAHSVVGSYNAISHEFSRRVFLSN